MIVNDSGTIAAISTAMNNSGIGIVRMSGPQAVRIAAAVFSGRRGTELTAAASHTIHYGYVHEGAEVIDEVLLMLMKGPHSYTKEDTVEINCHGGVFVVKKVLDLLIRHGARPAEPGEFTKRAFLNGRIDLSQAEAVSDLIYAQNDYALKSSVEQLQGNLKTAISEIRNKIIYNSAYIESALDDPEHISLEGYAEQLAAEVQEWLKEIKKLLASADRGKLIKEGIKTVIVGKPNAGKSSLLNVLLQEERAIVTEIAGTTRDTLEEQVNLGGILLNIIDTAGIRETSDRIESLGVARAREYAREADLVLYVIDAARPLDRDDREIFEIIREKKAIVLLNKSDLDMLVTAKTFEEAYYAGYPADETQKTAKKLPIIEISARNSTGIYELEEIIRQLFYAGKLSFNDEIYITNARQKAELAQAGEALNKLLDSITAQMPEDFYTIDLLDAYEHLGKITGETIGEDLVNEIFSKFCMGK